MALNPELLALLVPYAGESWNLWTTKADWNARPAVWFFLCATISPSCFKKRPSARMTGNADSARNNPAETRKACPPGHAFPL